MKQADRIRRFAIATYIEPARTKGDKTVQIRAGDLHDRLGLHDRLPAVCGALGALKFQTKAGVSLMERSGPHQGRNAVFVFEL
ncbi:MAG: hypothetical protein OXG46_09960 [Chloroflexi bacterium]|nr:hypothetical protein [Chloroflexota bacterium]MCY3937341.1 hypothetical protein [Chloroflexota bacterium]